MATAGATGGTPEFADALRMQLARHDVRFDHRTIVHPHDREVDKVLLLHLAGVDRDLVLQRGREAEHDTALHLLTDQVRDSPAATVDHADHPMHTNLLFGTDRYLHHLRDDTAERLMQRNAARPLPPSAA